MVRAGAVLMPYPKALAALLHAFIAGLAFITAANVWHGTAQTVALGVLTALTTLSGGYTVFRTPYTIPRTEAGNHGNPDHSGSTPQP